MFGVGEVLGFGLLGLWASGFWGLWFWVLGFRARLLSGFWVLGLCWFALRVSGIKDL